MLATPVLVTALALAALEPSPTVVAAAASASAALERDAVLDATVVGVAPGTYRLDVEVTAMTDMPLIGPQRSVTRTVSWVVVDDNAAAVAVPCRMTTEGPGFSSRVPASSLQAMPPARFSFAVRDGALVGDMGVGKLGFEGAGPVPEDAKDPRVKDTDGDGVPGMRVDVDLGAFGQHAVQMVGLGRTVLRGKVVDDGAAGNVAVRSQERVLSGLPMGASPAPSQVDPSRSHFKLQRVAATSCATLDTAVQTARR